MDKEDIEELRKNIKNQKEKVEGLEREKDYEKGFVDGEIHAYKKALDYVNTLERKLED